jgi:hypothetical protein
MSTRQFHQNKEDSDFPEECSLAKHLGAADEVWYPRYLTDRTQKGRQGAHNELALSASGSELGDLQPESFKEYLVDKSCK